MSPATFESVMNLVNEGKVAPLRDGVLAVPTKNPEVQLLGLLEDLNETTRNEFYALMALGQEACEQLPDKLVIPNDRLAFGNWVPRNFDEYRERAKGFSYDYFWGKPLQRYLPLARQVVKIFGLKTYRSPRYAEAFW
jgi:hypothetical protein